MQPSSLRRLVALLLLALLPIPHSSDKSPLAEWWRGSFPTPTP